ncbi:short-chain dehydrogenase reductase 2a [Cryptomeria japonica]|uniref:short-chain dehydrogenase reductase 2a n=1 Tax=Cryptomeria japonica TaxID=3369 RepID=UPI0027DA89D7|nr:short-chain dehydrogenase reductase 2a [Cryptomeria japonica]
MACTQRRLEGKVAIITGGASGIGEACVRLFTKHGAKVIIADISDEAGEKLAQALPPWATFIHCDVSKESDVSAAVDLAMQKYGQLDIMFNNAGIADAQKGTVAEYDCKQFEIVMNVNAKGVLHGMKHAGRVMIPAQKGCIISTASVAAVLGGGMSYAYTAAKHAVVGLSKSGAAELGKFGIRVNCVSPSIIATHMAVKLMEENGSSGEGEGRAMVEEWANSVGNLKGVTLKEEDIAEAALYLASDEARYVSGLNLVVDGGFTVVG